MIVEIPDGQTADEVYRLYRPEWVTVHYVIADDDGTCCPGLISQLREYFAATYAATVADADVRMVCDGEGINAVAQLQLRLPNLKGEFKHAFLAERFADERGYTDHQIVVRNSAVDKRLRRYGQP